MPLPPADDGASASLAPTAERRPWRHHLQRLAASGAGGPARRTGRRHLIAAAQARRRPARRRSNTAPQVVPVDVVAHRQVSQPSKRKVSPGLAAGSNSTTASSVSGRTSRTVSSWCRLARGWCALGVAAHSRLELFEGQARQRYSAAGWSRRPTGARCGLRRNAGRGHARRRRHGPMNRMGTPAIGHRVARCRGAQRSQPRSLIQSVVQAGALQTARSPAPGRPSSSSAQHGCWR